MKPLKVVLLLLVPLTALAAFVVVTSGALPYKVYVVHTGSMTPTIPSKSAVVVREHRYHVGQVITFTENGHVVTHRLVSISASGMTTTKGDANRSVDPWHVPTRQIIGGVVAAPRQVGYWLVYLKNPVGLASLLLSLLVCWEIWSLAGDGLKRPLHRIRPASADSQVTRPRHRIGANQSAQRETQLRAPLALASTCWSESNDGGDGADPWGVTFTASKGSTRIGSAPVTPALTPSEHTSSPIGLPSSRTMTVPSLVPSIGKDGTSAFPPPAFDLRT